MLIALKLKAAIAVGLGIAGPLAISAYSPDDPDASRPALIELAPGTISYRFAGDFTEYGKPTQAPLREVKRREPLTIMRDLVSAADYQRCVADKACARLPVDVDLRADRPAVQVSWRDAMAYARWLSARTGEVYRLPTDEEWAFAAGTHYRDDVLPVDRNDPSKRWLALYEREARRDKSELDAAVRPFGTFGTNEKGLRDIAGNVWEWTSTCFVRTALDKPADALDRTTVNCGVRVVEGRHRTYITDFIRDAKAGGCSVGTPPTHLGFRLVREPSGWWHRLAARLRGLSRDVAETL